MAIIIIYHVCYISKRLKVCSFLKVPGTPCKQTSEKKDDSFNDLALGLGIPLGILGAITAAGLIGNLPKNYIF